MPHGPVHREPLPVDATQFLKLLQSCLPEVEEESGLHLFLKALMGCGVRTQLGLLQGLPLTARAQDRDNGIRTVAIGRPRASSPKAMRVHLYRQQLV